MSNDANAGQDSQALPSGHRLEEFKILSKIGEGGFSIVYKAWDIALEREVALKEYLPSSIASRGSQTQVGVRTERNRQTFEAGIASFIREAQTLASFNHPGMVRVFRFFHANGTAYMAMPLYEGRTFRTVVEEMRTPPDEAWLMHVLHPLMDVLESVHAQNWYHRDIAPDNIMMVDSESRPILLDFGAARQVIGDMTQALTVVLKPGYAPIEQYAAIAEIKQGPWTDVYALAATIHWAITGKTPPIAAGRILQDSHVPLAVAAKGRYSEKFLTGIDAALKVKPADRTQNMGQFRNNIVSEGSAKANQPEVQSPLKASHPEEAQTAKPVLKISRIGMALFFGSATLLVAFTFSFYLRAPTPQQTVAGVQLQDGQTPVASPLPAPQPSERPTAPLAGKPTVVEISALPATRSPSPTATAPLETSSTPVAAKHPVAIAQVKKPAKPRSPVCDELLRKLSLGDGDSELLNQLVDKDCSTR